MTACSISPMQYEEALLRSVVLLRRSLLAAGLTGAGAAFFGIGSQEMADDAIDSLVAVPFTAEITAGKSVDLDVLGQAYAPNVAESVTIQDISQPASGSVSVINNRIRYTSNSGFAGADSFTYTLTSSGKSSTATIVITVRSSVSDPQTGNDAGPPPGGHPDIPGSTGLWNPVQGIDILALTPTQTINVANATQLGNAINTINTTSAAGRHIVLANGSYSGNYTIYAQGTEANPIVIRPATFLKASLTGTLTIAGRWVIVRGLNLRMVNFATSGSRIANNSRLSRCVVNNGSSTKINVQRGVGYCCFDRNEFVGGNGHTFEIRCQDDTPYNCIVWNLFRDSATGIGSSGAADSTLKLHQFTYAGSQRVQNLLVAWNRFQGGTNAYPFQTKVSGNVVLQNTVDIPSKGGASISFRIGRNNYAGGNYVVSGGPISMYGKGHKIFGNRSGVRLRPGNASEDQMSTWNSSVQGKAWTFAEDVDCIGNIGSITVEGPDPSRKLLLAPLRTLIENHTGSVTISSEARETIDRRNEAASQVVPVAYELLASQVGPLS
jgi:hypothetical protein